MIKRSQIKRTPEQIREITCQRSDAVALAWERERSLILQGKGTRNWNERQQREILERGSVRGFEGHHMISVQISAELAGDPDNIQFLTWREHLQAHRANYFNPTNGYYDPATGKMHSFRKGVPHQPAPVALSVISPVLLAAMNKLQTSGKNVPGNETGAEENTKGNTVGSGKNKVKNIGGSSGSQGGTGMINVDEQKYEDMISTLQNFASAIDERVGNMMALTQNCSSIMDGDEAVGKAIEKMRDVEKAYLEAAKEALSIAQTMSQELQEYRELKAQAASDD